MKHNGTKITITYNYVIRWMKIILRGSTSLKWMKPTNDLMLFVDKFDIIVDPHDEYPTTQDMCSMNFILDNINFNLSLSTIVECTCDDCIVIFFSHRREDGKGGGGGESHRR
jgi:hypothetical protein